MRNLPQDTIAFRREICVGIIAFGVGFVASLAGLRWLIVRFVPGDAHWWEILHMCINAFLISVVIGGLGFAALSVRALNWYHYKRGFYRCPYCGRGLKSVSAFCDCREARALKSGSSTALQC